MSNCNCRAARERTSRPATQVRVPSSIVVLRHTGSEPNPAVAIPSYRTTSARRAPCSHEEREDPAESSSGPWPTASPPTRPATRSWIPTPRPSVGLAKPTLGSLWPPNHKLIPVTIMGVTDSEKGQGHTQYHRCQAGDGDTAPDAVIEGSTVLLRAERSGDRATAGFIALRSKPTDGIGGVCTGEITVTVPRDRRGAACVDDGQSYSSLAP